MNGTKSRAPQASLSFQPRSCCSRRVGRGRPSRVAPVQTPPRCMGRRGGKDGEARPALHGANLVQTCPSLPSCTPQPRQPAEQAAPSGR